MSDDHPVPDSPVHFSPEANRGNTPTTCTESEPFALQVTDESMAPEFPVGCVVIIDPTASPVNGSFVIADSGAEGYLLRQLAIDAGGWRLVVANPAAQVRHPDTKIAPGSGAILGVVTQRNIPRRDRKIYR